MGDDVMAGVAAAAPRVQLRWHIAALTLALLIVWPLLDLDGAFSSDEGSYAVQARALEQDGTWDTGYAFAEADPTGRYAPFHGTVQGEHGVFTYVAHPLWPVGLASIASLVGEEVGFRLWGVISLVVLAAVAWGLAADVGGRRAAPWGFWVAAASPALANAWILWAHAPSAALSGLLMLGLLRSRRSSWWLLVAVTAGAVNVLLRSEALLWSVAVAGALVLAERTISALARASVVLGASGVAHLAQRQWVDEIIGAPVAGAGPATDLAARSSGASTLDRLTGLRIAVLDGAFLSSAAKLVGVAVAVTAVVAAVALRRGRPPGVVALLLGGVTALLVVRLAIDPGDPAPGLVVAAPVLVLAFAWRPPPASAWLALAVGLFVLAVGATIYPDGGSLQWGGRFLSPTLGPLAAFTGSVIAGRTSPGDRWRHRPVALAAVGLLLVQATAGLVAPDRLRQLSERPVAKVVAAGPAVLVADGRQIARLDWQGWPDRCWLAVPDDGGAEDLRAILEVLGRSGVRRAAYAGFDATELAAAGVAAERVLPGLDAGTLVIPAAPITGDIASPYTCEP